MGDSTTHTATADMTPEALLEAVGAGHSEAVLALYDRFGSVLLGVAMRVLGNPTESEDVVQDVFTRVWREAASFDRSRGTALAWLITLCRNRAIDVVRQRRRRSQHTDEIEQEGPVMVPDAPTTPEGAVVEAQRADAVRRAMEQLRPEQRAVLELAYFSGLSHSEIAAELDQPLGTVKTRIAQAVKRLRDELGVHRPSRPPPAD